MSDLNTLSRWMVIVGLGIAAAGGALWAAGRLGVPLGRLPGDFRFQAGGLTCFVPLATSLLLSLLLTLLLTLIGRSRGP